MAKYSHRFCVAPMLDCTDTYFRLLLRQITKKSVLYSEMLTTKALLHGDSARFLAFNTIEHPIALQLGGSDIAEMTQCAELAQHYGYDEVNINVGCPSDRVQAGAFGACLLKTPKLVAQMTRKMCQATDIPITIKTRIGVDEYTPAQTLWPLVEQCAYAGCDTFIVHARKAWLQGLSPKQNRNIPPLDYEVVYQLKQDFPELRIIINGGITSLQAAEKHLQQVDGVMMGREAYKNPFLLKEVDALLFGLSETTLTRKSVLNDYMRILASYQNVPMSLITKHLMGLFYQQYGGKVWRRYLSAQSTQTSFTAQPFYDAYQQMQNIV